MWGITNKSSVTKTPPKKLCGSYLSIKDAQKDILRYVLDTYKRKPWVRPKFKYKTVGRPTKYRPLTKSASPDYVYNTYQTPEMIQQMKEEYQKWQKQRQ